MANGKESLKKSLGITEYPWSSDDDTENPRNRLQTGTQTSVAEMPGTSGQPSNGQPARFVARRNHPRLDRNVYWSLWSDNQQQSSSSSLLRSRSEQQCPVSRPTQSYRSGSYSPSTYSTPCTSQAADMQRILAYRRINRNLKNARAARSNVTNVIAIPRRDPIYSTASQLATEISSLIKAKHKAQARAAAAAISEPVASERTHNDSEEPEASTSGLRSRHNNHSNTIDEAAMESVNIDQSDDDVEMTHTAMSPVAERTEDNVEGDATEGDSHNTTRVSLEEVVELDVEPDASAVQDTSANNEMDVANNVPDENVPNENPNNEEAELQPHDVKRRRETVDDAGPLTVQEFNQNLLRLLECPVCMDWMEPPMSQCRRGHLVCGRCRERLITCPVCRTTFSSVRNRAMEEVAEMLRYPCRHGCGREVRLRRRVPHESSCLARRYRCVVPVCASRPPMPHEDLAMHFQNKHLTLVKVGRRHMFSMKVNAEQHDTWVIMALGELFHLRIDVDVRVVAYVAYIGPKCNANTYRYEVTVIGHNNCRKLMYARATHCDLECSSLNMSRQDCFHLNMDQALNFVRTKTRTTQPERLLNIIVEITKNNEAEAVRPDSDC